MSRAAREERIARARAAAGLVVDPVLGRALDELGMVSAVSEDRGGLLVELALPTSEHPAGDELTAAVGAAVEDVLGRARRVRVTSTSMTPYRRVELAQHLRATTPPLSGGLGNRTRIYAVASGKGGVGKSTITANLAAARAAAGDRVGVLDADVWGHSIPHMFGVHANPLTVGDLMLPVRAHGVALMSVGFFVDPAEPVVWRGPMLHKALEQFLTDTYWGQLDVLFIDLPPGTGDIGLSLVELLPEAALLAVTTPGASAHTVAERVLTMAARDGMPIAGVVENMSAAVCAHCGEQSEVFGSGGGRRLADQAGVELLGRIPLDTSARVAGDDGVPVVLADPAAASARSMIDLGQRLPTVHRALRGRSLPLAVV